MAFLDFVIYILGVYGLAWLISQSKITFPLRNYFYTDSGSFFQDLITCIVCTSVWISAGFVWFYFPAECWYTKLLVIGTTTTTTWIIANLIGDVD